MPILSRSYLRRRAVIFFICLLLPVTFTSIVYVREAYDGIHAIKRERIGLQLIQAITKTYFWGQNRDAMGVDGLARSLNLELEKGLEKFQPAVRLGRLAAWHSKVIDSSGLSLDDTKQTYYLVSANFMNLQRSLQHLTVASRFAAMVDTGNNDAQLGNYANSALSELGAANEFAKLAAKDLETACDCPIVTNDGFHGLRARLAIYGEALQEAHQAALATRTSSTLLTDMNGRIGSYRLQDFANRVAEMWDEGSRLIDDTLAQRVAAAWRKIILTATVGFAITLFGCGYILTAHRQSLAHMGELEVALKESEAARAATDAMNDEIASLNKNLSENLENLKAAQDQLLNRSRLEQLGQLTATIAHEIRNPMGAIRTSAFLIEKKTKNNGLGIETQLQRINTGIVRCDKIITQLLDFSRTKKIDAFESNLDDFLENAVVEEAQQLPTEIQLVCELGLDGKKVPFDQVRLRRAVLNLIGNAADAFKDMEGRSPEDPPTIWLTTRVSPTHAFVDVRDNGPGIKPENLSRIMEPLFTTKGFGTGLGLPAVSQIANQHGGELVVKSVLGQGATFTISLALSQGVSQAA